MHDDRIIVSSLYYVPISSQDFAISLKNLHPFEFSSLELALFVLLSVFRCSFCGAVVQISDLKQ